MKKDTIIVFIPRLPISEANNSDNHWKKRNRRIALQNEILAALKNRFEFFLPAIITFERIGKKLLDEDNLQFCFKNCRDMTAKVIIDSVDKGPIKPIGSYDGDDRLKWRYSQKSNLCEFGKKHTLGFWITIEPAIEKIVLSDRDRDVFLEALRNPPEPNENLKKAFSRLQNETNCTQKSDSSRLTMFKDLGLLGSIDDSDITSENYKKFLP